MNSLSVVIGQALLAAELNGIGAAIVFGMVGFACAISMGLAISKSADAISRQPSAEGKIRGALMIGLAFIETIAIYGLLVAILLMVLK